VRGEREGGKINGREQRREATDRKGQSKEGKEREGVERVVGGRIKRVPQKTTPQNENIPSGSLLSPSPLPVMCMCKVWQF